MRHLIIIKKETEKAKIIEFESVKELKADGYNTNNFRADFNSDFVIQEIVEDGIFDTRYRIEPDEDPVRVYCNSIDVDIFKI